MPDSEPLTVLFSRALGGVPTVDRLEVLGSRALLTALGRPDLIARLERAQEVEALALNDHRAQAACLYGHRCAIPEGGSKARGRSKGR